MSVGKLRTCVLLVGAWGLLSFPSGASAQFADVTSGPLAYISACFGAAWGDYDKDGDEDLFLANGSGQSRLLRHDPGDVFINTYDAVAAGDGADMGAAWADHDNDGDLDLYVTNANGTNRLLNSDHGTAFAQSSAASPNTGLAQCAAWGDYNRDGLVDVFVTYWSAPNKLFRNLGSGVFSDVTPAVLADPQKNTGAAWGDYDNDGDLDLMVGAHIASKLYRNNAGVFQDVSDAVTTKSGVNGVAWGDYDNDGDLDLYLARGIASSRLLRNDSSGSSTVFVDMIISVLRVGGVGQGVSWLDYDNDGDLDIFLAIGGSDNSSGAANHLFRNNGGDSFTETSAGPVLAVANSRGVAVADYDRNGTEDVLVMNWQGSNQLLENVYPSRHWLQVRLVGTQSNKSGIGARIRVVAAGKVQTREISSGSGLYSQSSLVAHFGLADSNDPVDTLQVKWPSGVVTQLTGVATNQRLELAESGLPVGIGDDPRDLPVAVRLLPNAPNPFPRSTSIRYELKRDSPVDLRVLDLGGRLVRVLEHADLVAAGTHRADWDGRDERGDTVARGVYFYTLDAAGERQTRRMVFLP